MVNTDDELRPNMPNNEQVDEVRREGPRVIDEKDRSSENELNLQNLVDHNYAKDNPGKAPTERTALPTPPNTPNTCVGCVWVFFLIAYLYCFYLYYFIHKILLSDHY